MQPTGRQQDQFLRLAVCEVSPEDQEWLVASLRSAGVSSRVSPFFNASALSSMVSANEVDVVVWGDGALGCSLSDTLATAGPVPVVVAASSFSNEFLAEVRLSGAADVYVRGVPDLAVKVLALQADIFALRRRAQAAQAAAEDAERRSDALIDAVKDPIAYLSEGLHVKANQAYLDLLGMGSFEDLEGMSILDFVEASDLEAIREKIKRLGREALPTEEMEVSLSNGKSVQMSFSSAHYDGEPCLQITAQRADSSISVSLLPATPAGDLAGSHPPPSLEDWMKRDASTGLFNRAHFLDELAGRKTGFCWLVRLEHHEKVVETVGPTRLDQVMMAAGKLLSTHLPAEAIVSRWAGGLISVLSEGLGQEEMAQLRSLMSQEFLEVAGRSFQSPVVAGGVVLNESLSADQTATILERALAEARSSSDGVCLIDPLGKTKEKAKRAAAETYLLKHALEKGLLVAYFQPIVSLMGGPEAYQVIVRMPAGQGFLDPARFDALVETSGLSLDVDKWVVKRAVEKISAHQKSGKKVHLVVGLSSAALADPGFSDYAGSCLSQSQVSPEFLAFEVDMGLALTHAKQTLDFKGKVAAKGHSLLISGVDMDPSGLRSLSALKPSWIKLSQESIVRLSQSSDGPAELEKMLTAASKENIRVLVGFVEDAVLLTTLFSLGVDSAQGSFLSPPLPEMTYDFSQFMG